MNSTSVEAYMQQRYTSFHGKMLELLDIHGADEYPYKVVVGFLRSGAGLIALPYSQPEGYGDAHPLIAARMNEELAIYGGNAINCRNALVGTVGWEGQNTERASKCAVDLRNLTGVVEDVCTVLHVCDGEQIVRTSLEELKTDLCSLAEVAIFQVFVQ